MPTSAGAEIASACAHTLKRAVTHIARLVIGLAVPMLLFASWVPLDPSSEPVHPNWEMFASRVETFRFHMGIILGGAAVCLLALRSWRFALLGVLIGAWTIVPSMVWPNEDRRMLPGSPAIRVLSLNLGGELAQEDLVLEAVKEAEPDVLVIQEYTPSWKRRLAGPLAGRLLHRMERPRTDNFGMAIFSRIPWTRLEQFEFAASGTPQFRVELPLGNSSVALYALHLLPPTRGLYAEHRSECVSVLHRLGREGRRTLVIGDFNFVDHGHVGRALHDIGYLDAHGLAEGGRGATWPVNGWLHHLPGIRIDHIYLGQGLTSTASWVGPHTGSDHLPIGCTVTLAREQDRGAP